MSELTITAAGFTLQPTFRVSNGPAILRWAYNRAFLDSDGVQVFAGTQTKGFGVEAPCAVADGLITVEQDSLLWTTDNAQDPSPGSIWVSAWLLTPRRVLIAQLTIAGKTQFSVTESLAPSCTWEAFSNYNQADVLFQSLPPSYYTAAETNRVIDQSFDTHPASDLALGTVLLTVPADNPDQPVVWGANDPLVRDAADLQGIPISDTPPLDGQTLLYNEALNEWEPGNQNPGTGNVISNEVSSVDGEIVLFSGTGGKTIRRGDQTGLLRGTSGVVTATTVATSDLDDDAVTYAKMQNVSAASRLLGRGSAGEGAGNTEEISLGSGMIMTGTTLSATGTGGDVTAAANLTDEAIVVGDGGLKGVQTTPVTVNPSTGLMVGATVDAPVDPADIANKEFVLNSVAAAVQQTPNISALVSGGGVLWESDYNFRVSAATYLIQGDLFTSTEQTITLDAADPTLDRIDVIALDDTGTVVKITGTAAAQPSQPDVDPATQLQLTFVLVGAATTEPPNVANEDIYIDNTEWTATTSGSGWNPDSTNNPRSGTKDIEGTNVANNAYVQLGAPSPLTLDPYALLSVFIRSKAAWPKNRSLLFQWYSSGVAVGVAITINTGFFGFDSSITGSYQLVAIPIASFSVPAGTSLNQLRITDKGGAIGMYIDDIVLQAFGGDIGSPPTPGLTQEQADARYAQRANNLSDLSSASTARTNLGLGTLATQSGTFSGTSSGTNTGDVTLAGTPDYITIAGQVITRNQVDLTADVTGDLPLANLAQASAASKLLGRGDSGAGDYQEITLGTNLTMTGTTLDASGGGSSIPESYRFEALNANPNATTLTAVGGQSGSSSGTVASADDADGVFQSRTTTASVNNSAGLEPGTTFSMIRREWLPTTFFRIKTGSSIAVIRIMVGMFSADPSGNPMPVQHCAGFRYSTDEDGTAFWRTITNDGSGSGTVTTTTAPIAVDTAYDLKIEQDASEVRFYIDDTLVATHTTELPGLSNANAPNVKVTTLENVAKTLKFSFWKVWHK